MVHYSKPKIPLSECSEWSSPATGSDCEFINYSRLHVIVDIVTN